MTPYEQIKSLRKSGNLQQAETLARAHLKDHQDDIWVKRELGWVFYAYIKQSAQRIEDAHKLGRAGAATDAEKIGECTIEYSNLKLPKPEMSFGHIVRAVSAVGKHLDFYSYFIEWANRYGFGTEDFEPNEFQGNTSPALVTKVAKELLAWCVSHPSNASQFSELVEALAEKALSNKREAPNMKVWVEYARYQYYVSRGDFQSAVDDMKRVLKLKQKDYWAWQKLGIALAHFDPEGAIGCYGQAMMCQPEPKFTGALHIEFSNLLYQVGDIPRATAEVLCAVNIYDSNGWSFPESLESLLQSAWFDSGLGQVDQKSFYASVAEKALIYLYDSIEKVPATFLKQIQFKNKAGKNLLRWVVASKVGEESEQTLVKAPSELSEPQPGEPCNLTYGIRSGKREVISIDLRPDGELWDSLSQREGVVENISHSGGMGGVYFDRSNHGVLMSVIDRTGVSLSVGDPVTAWFASNPGKDGRCEVHLTRKMGRLSANNDISEQNGLLKRHEKGFGFVEDVFVPASLICEDKTGENVTVLAIKSFDKVKGRYGWKAINLTYEPA